MAIRNYPGGDRKVLEFVQHFRPMGSKLVVWAQNMATNQMYYLLRWGNDIYLPVGMGDHIGIGIYNGSSEPVAIPMYVEGRNIWDGGPSRPESCTPDHMWELYPYQQMVCDALMNPNAQQGRPLVIVRSGTGYGIGEATFATTEFRGQICIYQRNILGGTWQQSRPMNVGHGDGTVLRGFASRGSGEVTRGGDTLEMKGSAAIGAGAAEHRAHHDTGIRYQTNAQPVVFLRMEERDDLKAMADQHFGFNTWNWFWPMPTSTKWWELDWSWRPTPTAPEVPVARPHRPGYR